ncbi:MAG: YdcF family protein [Alphaproteobacteria bacterium]|nr:YdcF family protein [Alphaproteobacteria bacterium]MBU0794238.1 YdcF family protein [Alphaproteobacteria bacterium]MBU0876589.1 YdcF family protein [Alphaproteobacteria bacterium]MBU1769290.1 YdcF family protein [Alphaproteobacteria bacterium]
MIRRFLAVIVLGWALGFAWFALLLPQPHDDEKTDAIVVLTGSAGRIDRGLALLRREQSRHMLVSGVDRDVKRGEFAALYKVSPEMMRCCITLGREAIDTRSNAIETSQWLRRNGYTSMRIITADWHMRRARYELSRQLDRSIRIVPDAVRSNPSLAVLLREYHKYLLRRVAGLLGI